MSQLNQTTNFYLNTYTNQSAVLNAIFYGQPGGLAVTDLALASLTMNIFTPTQGARSGVAKIAVIITSGYSLLPDVTQTQAASVRQAGVELFVVSEAPQPNLIEIDGIATPPISTHVFTLSGSGNVVTASTGLLDALCQK